MYYCVYTSSASKDLPDHELMDIKSESTTASEKAGITGLLVLHRSIFIHCYEGEKAAVSKVLASTKKDKRHKDVTIISEGEIPERQFPNWSMELRVLDKDPLFTAGELANDRLGIKKQINDHFLKIK